MFYFTSGIRHSSNNIQRCIQNWHDVRTAGQFRLVVAHANCELVNLASDLKLMKTLEEFEHEKYIICKCDWSLVPCLIEKDEPIPFHTYDYAQNIPDYFTHMKKQPSFRMARTLRVHGDFVARSNHVAFTSIGPDNAQEDVNKASKGEGTISGLTTDSRFAYIFVCASPNWQAWLTKPSVY